MTNIKTDYKITKKEVMLDKIYQDYPDYNRDSLKRHIIENMVDSFLKDPDAFNRRQTEIQKKEKKGTLEKLRKIESEVICIERKDADTQTVPQDLTVDNHGYIKVSS